MFHTLFDYQEQNIANNRQKPKKKSQGFLYKSSKKNNQNYYGKGNQAYDIYNQNNNDDSDNSESSEGNYNEKFEKTKNKVKAIVYKNGFILDNGPFRDAFIPENKEFLDQVERSVIPHELVEKGIIDGIYLINYLIYFFIN